MYPFLGKSDLVDIVERLDMRVNKMVRELMCELHLQKYGSTLKRASKVTCLRDGSPYIWNQLREESVANRFWALRPESPKSTNSGKRSKISLKIVWVQNCRIRWNLEACWEKAATGNAGKVDVFRVTSSCNLEKNGTLKTQLNINWASELGIQKQHLTRERLLNNCLWCKSHYVISV